MKIELLKAAIRGKIDADAFLPKNYRFSIAIEGQPSRYWINGQEVTAESFWEAIRQEPDWKAGRVQFAVEVEEIEPREKPQKDPGQQTRPSGYFSGKIEW